MTHNPRQVFISVKIQKTFAKNFVGSHLTLMSSSCILSFATQDNCPNKRVSYSIYLNNNMCSFFVNMCSCFPWKRNIIWDNFGCNETKIPWQALFTAPVKMKMKKLWWFYVMKFYRGVYVYFSFAQTFQVFNKRPMV